MSTATRIRRPVRPSRFALTVEGLTAPKRAEIHCMSGYYFGASSSPSFVIVIGLTDDLVSYVDARTLEVQRAQRWIFEDLVGRAAETIRKDAERTAAAAVGADTTKAMGRLAVQIAEMCEWRMRTNGSHVEPEGYDRVRATLRGEGDVYGRADQFGVLVDWNPETGTAIVEGARREFTFDALVKAQLNLDNVETIKECPLRA